MQTLEEKIRRLPPDLAQEVEDFIEFLLAKRQLLVEAEESSFWQASSQPSLEAVWANAEDDVYAELLKA
jgi:hypothetical protein